MDGLNFTGLWGRSFVYSYISTKGYTSTLYDFITLIYQFAEDVISWIRGTHEFHEN